MGTEPAPGFIPVDAAQRLKGLLEGISGQALSIQSGPGQLGGWYQAWRAQFPSDESCLHALAEHDLRMLFCTQFDHAPEELTSLTIIREKLPSKDTRKAWDEIRRLSEWDLPRMGMPAWAQTLFGILFMAGFVLPFVDALWGSFVLPVVVPLSFLLERKWAHLAYPTFEAMAGRMVVQNKLAIELGKFDPEDLERVLFELAGLASGMDTIAIGLDPKDWQTVEVEGI